MNLVDSLMLAFTWNDALFQMRGSAPYKGSNAALLHVPSSEGTILYERTIPSARYSRAQQSTGNLLALPYPTIRVEPLHAHSELTRGNIYSNRLCAGLRQFLSSEASQRPFRLSCRTAGARDATVQDLASRYVSTALRVQSNNP
jgi:hypothetical protein